MRILLKVFLAMTLLALGFAAPPTRVAFAQNLSLDDLARGDPERIVADLERAQRAMGATGSVEERGAVAAGLVYIYSLASKIANGDDLAELDKRHQETLDWMLATPGLTAAQRIEWEVIGLAYYLDSGRPGLMLSRAQAVTTRPAATVALRAAASAYVAQAYMHLGALDEAEAALAQTRDLLVRISPDDLESARGVYAQVGMQVWATRGDLNKVRDAWMIALRLFETDQLPDAVLLSLAQTAFNAGLNSNWPGLAREASPYVELFLTRLFPTWSAQDKECASLMWRLPTDMAASSEFPVLFARCTSELGDDLSTPRELLLAGARVLELQGASTAAAEAYEKAIVFGERARASAAVSTRQTFFEGSERLLYQGAIRAHTVATVRGNDRAKSFYSAVAATERMRARQYADVRGDAAPPATPRQILDFARSLPDGVLVVVISMLDRERVALAFNKSHFYYGLASNITAETKGQAVSRLRAMLTSPDSDTAERERFSTAYTASLLIGARSSLAGASKVIVIGDGPDALVPAALWSTSDSAYRPLSETAEITYAPALRDLMGPPRSRPPTQGLFAMGAPVFPQVPTALGLTPAQAFAASAKAGATGDRNGGIVLQPLPNSEFEVRDIARDFAPNAITLFEDQASERAVKSADLSRTKFLHFATHGLLAGDFAGLAEPALALAPGGGEDGFLSASEVQSLKLNADLTVLSACNTSSGRLVAGEGVIGLSRAFLVAGSHAVLASLWPVDDATTELFMSGFYERLRAGASPAVALKETAAAVRVQKPHPKFWAPFILVQAS